MVLVAAACDVVQYADEGTQCVGMVQPCPLRRVRLADRIAAWFGYVPREWYYDALYAAMRGIKWRTLHGLSGPSHVVWEEEPNTLVADVSHAAPCVPYRRLCHRGTTGG